MNYIYVSLSLIFMFLKLSSAKSLNTRQTGNVKKSCKLLDIPLEQNLDLSKLQGLWYGTMKTGMGDSMLAYFAEIYDARIQFKRNTEGGFDLKAAGSKFYGGWCPKGKGKAVIPDAKNPAMMTMFFDTTIGRKIGMKPGWILKTDYSNYAIIFSCWKELADGRCEPDQAYAAVIQRTSKPLPQSKLAEVEKALKSACVNIKRLSRVIHYGYCIDKEGL
ncbi:hypothetical protein ACF0H5_000372 [Mactra antiquata]